MQWSYQCRAKCSAWARSVHLARTPTPNPRTLLLRFLNPTRCTSLIKKRPPRYERCTPVTTHPPPPEQWSYQRRVAKCSAWARSCALPAAHRPTAAWSMDPTPLSRLVRFFISLSLSIYLSLSISPSIPVYLSLSFTSIYFSLSLNAPPAAHRPTAAWSMAPAPPSRLVRTRERERQIAR